MFKVKRASVYNDHMQTGCYTELHGKDKLKIHSGYTPQSGKESKHDTKPYEKEARVAILHSEELHPKTKTGDNKTLHNDNRIDPTRRVNNENTYASHIGVPKCIKQTLKEKTVSKTITEGGFNTPLTSVNKSSTQ